MAELSLLLLDEQVPRLDRKRTFKHMITPIEVKQQTFKKGFQGYNKDEVQAFLNTLSVEWERVLDELKRTKQDLEKTSTQLDGLRQVESALHKTLLQAEETSRHTIESAKQEAETKIKDANDNAKEIVQKAIDERGRIETQIKDLVARRDEILKQLKGYLVAQTERLKTFEDKEVIEAPDFAKPKKAKKAAPVKPEAIEPVKQKEKPVEANDKDKAPQEEAKNDGGAGKANAKEELKKEPVQEGTAKGEEKSAEKVVADKGAETAEAPKKGTVKVEVKTEAKAAPVAPAAVDPKDSGAASAGEGKKTTIKIVAKDKADENAAKGNASAAKNENPTESEDNSGIKVKLASKEPAEPAKEEKSGSFFDQSVASNDDGGYIDDIVDEL